MMKKIIKRRGIGLRMFAAVLFLVFQGMQSARAGTFGVADDDPQKDRSEFRVLLISDIHYCTDSSVVAGGDRLGYTQQERMETMVSNILKEHAEKPLSAVFVLGDLSIDDYGYRNLQDNFCKKLKAEYLDRLPIPVYAIAGNHDSYPNNIWEEVMGRPRQYSVVINGVAFILVDTFNGTASSASGAPYTPIDMTWLSAEMAKFKEKPIVLCAHHFDWGVESAEFKNMLIENDHIISLFSGHTHLAKVMQLSSYGNRYHVDIGCFSYYSKPINGKSRDFDHFDPGYAWGYQILDVADGKATTYHKTVPMKYDGSNGVHQMEAQLSAIYSFDLKQ